MGASSMAFYATETQSNMQELPFIHPVGCNALMPIDTKHRQITASPSILARRGRCGQRCGFGCIWGQDQELLSMDGPFLYYAATPWWRPEHAHSGDRGAESTLSLCLSNPLHATNPSAVVNPVFSLHGVDM